MSRPVVWSVGASDCVGANHLQADLRALDALRTHACTIAAAVLVPGGKRAQAMSPDLVEAQFAGLVQDLSPLAIKAGHLGSAENARLLARWVKRLREQRPVALVLDPVGPAGAAASPAETALRRVLREELLPLATVCTPNRREAAWLLGEAPLADEAQLLAAIPALESLGPCSWLVTDSAQARDLLISPQFQGWLATTPLDTHDRQGCSCTLSAALAGALAQGFCEADAAVLAKMAVTQALQAAEPAGSGAGPVRAEPGFARHIGHLPQAWPLAGAAPGPSFAPADDLGVCAVVDSAAWVARLAQAGVRHFQLRIKRRPDAALLEELKAALAAARSVGGRLDVNEHWRLALEAGADGLYLDPEDIDASLDWAALQQAGLSLGLGARSMWELARVAALGPSYVGFGPVHAGRSSPAPWRPQGVHNLSYASGLLNVPVLAFGGLTPERVRNAARCGIAGVAVGVGLTASFDPEAQVEAYHKAWSEGRRLVPYPVPELPQPSLAVGVAPQLPPA